MGDGIMSPGGYISDVAKYIDPVQEEYVYSEYLRGMDEAQRVQLADLLSGMDWEVAERKRQAAANATYTRWMQGKRRLWEDAEDKLRAEQRGSDNSRKVGCTVTDKVAA